MILKPPKGAMLNRGHPLARGLKGCWLMNEGGGTIVNDMSRNGGVIQLAAAAASPTWSACDLGPALSFDGGDYAIQSFETSPLDITGSLTIVTYVNPSSLTGYPTVVSKWGASGNKQFKLAAALNNGAPYIDISPNGSGDVYRAGASNLTVGAWNQLAGVYNSTAATLDIYKNGVLSNGGLTGTVTTSIFSSSARICVGASDDASFSNKYSGKIGYVYIYNRALTPTDIMNLYRSPFCMFEVDL